MNSLRDEVRELNPELIALRRDFHGFPELGFREFETSRKVQDYLRTLGLEVKSLAQTGVVGLLRGGRSGKTVMLRSDMDALPIQEDNALPYRSQCPGIMHACGHDGHMAMLLAAAKLLARRREEITGCVKFVFQPNEEVAGAGAMIEAGVLQDPAVDAAFAIHLWSALPSGTVGLSSGAVTAGLTIFDLTVLGKGGHTGYPQEAIDPILTAAGIVQAVQAVQTREISQLEPTIIMFGQIHGGTKANVVPESVQLSGSLRCLYEGGEQDPEGRFERIVKGICDAHRARYELKFTVENHPVLNDPGMVRLARQSAEETLGSRGRLVEYTTLVGEDFSEYCRQVPGALAFLGVADRAKGSDYPHHSSRFNIDEDMLAVGVEMHVRSALNYLRSQS
jgi:amidohydrolase